MPGERIAGRGAPEAPFVAGEIADRGPLERGATSTALETRAREARELERQKAWRDQAARALQTLKADEGTAPINADALEEDDDLDALPLGAEEGSHGETVLVHGGSPLPTLRVLPQGISRKRLEQAVRDLGLPVVIARDVDEADVVMTLKNEYKQKTPLLREAEERAMPIYVLKSNTVPQMQTSLTSIFSLEIDPREAAMRETEDAIDVVLSSRRAGRAIAPERVHPAVAAPDGGAGESRVALARPGAVPAGAAVSGRRTERLALTPPSGPGPVTDAEPVAPRPMTLRRGLRRLSTGLIAYGVLGLVLAVVGGLALVWVGGRVGGIADRTGEQVESIVSTLDQTALVLSSMGTSATSFSGTLERTPPAVRQTAQTVGNLRQNLILVESQLSAINILGARPLANAANLFGQMATDLEGLDGRLEVIAADLDSNREALLDNSTKLQALGTELEGLADGLRGGVVEESLADIQLILAVLSVLLVVWLAFPAAGALALGWWLRRETLDPDGDGPVAP